MSLIKADIYTVITIADELDSDSRQGKYSIDALRYLSYVQKDIKKWKYILSLKYWNFLEER